jgi:hypothetical protein
VARDAAGNSSPQASLQATTSACSALAAPSNRYTDINFAAGKYAGLGETIFEAVGSDPRLSDWGGTDPVLYDQWGMTTDPNQRVHLFHPASVGLPSLPGSTWASWQELRHSDGPWVAGYTLAKASLSWGNNRADTWGPAGFSYGAVRWFAWDILFPLNINDGTGTNVSFEFVNNFHTMFDLHTSVDFDDDPLLGDITPHSGNPRYLSFTQTPDAHGGTGVPYVVVPLIQLTNADGSRHTSAYNVWHEVVVGIKASKDSSGWYEVWVDGQQVAPQTARQIVSSADTGPYMQMQNYTEWPTNFVSGADRGAVVYGGFRAGLTRADVQTR